MDEPPASLPTYPADGVAFSLSLDGTAHDPIAMVYRDGYNHPEQWKFTGKCVSEHQTRRFMLVSIGYCWSFAEVRRRLAKYGTIPNGQWREAFKVKYPRPDSKGPIGFADSSWVDQFSSTHFPCVGTDGNLRFSRADHDFSVSWRWLIEVKGK